MTEHIYKSAGGDGAPGGGPGANADAGGPKPDDVIDVEFEEKK